VLTVFAGIADNDIRKSIPVYISHIKPISFTLIRQAVAYVEKRAGSVAQVVFVVLVIFRHENAIEVAVGVEVGQPDMFHVVGLGNKSIFLPGKNSCSVVEIKSVGLRLQCED